MKKPDPKKADNEQVAAMELTRHMWHQVKDTLKKALQEAGMWDLFEDIEMPLVFTLDDMEKGNPCKGRSTEAVRRKSLDGTDQGTGREDL